LVTCYLRYLDKIQILIHKFSPYYSLSVNVLASEVHKGTPRRPNQRYEFRIVREWKGLLWLGTSHCGGGGSAVRGSGSEETNWPEL
jgi:hypothetical protein